MECKIINETKEVIEDVYFEASDGTKFYAKKEFDVDRECFWPPTRQARDKANEECKRYEESAEGVIKSRFTSKAKLLTGDASCYADDFFDDEYGSSSSYLYKIENEQDLVIINMFSKIVTSENIYCDDFDSRERQLEIGKTYLIIVNYEFEWCEAISEEEFLKRVNVIFHGENKDDTKSVEKAN